MRTLGLLFGLRQRVSRSDYLVWGLLLALLKYGLDAVVVYAGSAEWPSALATAGSWRTFER